MNYYEESELAIRDADQDMVETALSNEKTLWFTLAKAAIFALLAIANSIGNVADRIDQHG